MHRLPRNNASQLVSSQYKQTVLLLQSKDTEHILFREVFQCSVFIWNPAFRSSHGTVSYSEWSYRFTCLYLGIPFAINCILIVPSWSYVHSTEIAHMWLCDVSYPCIVSKLPRATATVPWYIQLYLNKFLVVTLYSWRHVMLLWPRLGFHTGASNPWPASNLPTCERPTTQTSHTRTHTF